jgi:hypothetical protein
MDNLSLQVELGADDSEEQVGNQERNDNIEALSTQECI